MTIMLLMTLLSLGASSQCALECGKAPLECVHDIVTSKTATPECVAEAWTKAICVANQDDPFERLWYAMQLVEAVVDTKTAFANEAGRDALLLALLNRTEDATEEMRAAMQKCAVQFLPSPGAACAELVNNVPFQLVSDSRQPEFYSDDRPALAIVALAGWELDLMLAPALAHAGFQVTSLAVYRGPGSVSLEGSIMVRAVAIARTAPIFEFDALRDALSSLHPAPVRIVPADDEALVALAALARREDVPETVRAALAASLSNDVMMLASKWEWSVRARQLLAADKEGLFKTVRVPDAVLFDEATWERDFLALGNSNVMVKLEHSSGASFVRRAATRTLVRDAAAELRDISELSRVARSSRLIMQQLLQGEPTLIVAVAVAQSGRLLGGYVARVLENFRGSSAVLSTVRIQAVEDFVGRFVESANVTGWVAFDFLHDVVTGAYFMIDLNPRLIAMACFATADLAEETGVDLCLEYRMHVAGQPSNHTMWNVASNVVFVNPFQEIRRDCDSPNLAPWQWNLAHYDPVLMSSVISAGQECRHR